MKTVSILCAPPQFIKAAAICRALLKYKNMLDIFFDQMKTPEPRILLKLLKPLKNCEFALNKHPAMSKNPLIKKVSSTIRQHTLAERS